MSNEFNKEEKVAFDQIIEGFSDSLVLSRNVSKYETDQVMMERTGDIIWRPQPYIAQSFSGTDMTAKFYENTQLSVPASINASQCVPWILTSTELRDELQSGRLVDAAKQRLASDIDSAVRTSASLYGSLVVKRTAAATGYDDLSLCDTMFNEQGIPDFNRYFALGPRDYNAMAGNLAARYTMTGKPTTAYEKAYLGQVANFETYKMGIAKRLAAAAGGAAITMDTRDAAVNYYVPKATSTAATGEKSNVDNRFQTIVVSATANVAAGDAFTVAGLNSVHHITKEDTGSLKTFRVVSVTDGTHLVITPPMITNQVAAAASAQYQNCVINTKAANSAIVWLNTVAAPVNCFWQKDAIEILPGRFAIPGDAGASVLRATTENGMEVIMSKQVDINTLKTKLRVDTRYGVCAKQPEMMGIILFSQT